MSKFARFRTRKPARHAASVAPLALDESPYFPYDPKVPGIRTRTQTVREPLPNYRDPSGLALAQKPGDGFTLVMPAVESPTPTMILPTAVTPLPQHRDGLWRPAFESVPVTAVKNGRRARQILTDLPSQRKATAEDSYESLAAYASQRRLDPRKALFRPLPDDETPFARSFQAWLNSSGVIRNNVPARPQTALDTATFAAVSTGEFPTTTQGRAA